VVLNDLADEITEAKEQAKKEKKRADKAEKLAKEEKKKAEEEKKLRYTYILRMKEQGYPIEDLMKITGLSREEIESM
jgi:uncharacterized phage infection (PIP) family protein YhgE